jgi:hypothetical protein
MYLRRVFYLALAATLLGFSSTANADLILGLQLDDATTSRTINSGDTVFLDLTLSDTNGSTLFPSEGLLSAGGRLLQSAGSIIMGLPTTTDVDSLWGAGIFNNNPASAGGPTEIGKALGATDFLVGPAAGSVFPLTSSTIRIARFAYTATGAAGATATIVSDILGAGFEGIVTFDTDTILDGSVTSFGSVELTISGAAAIPEPASMILASLTAAVAGGGSYLRRKKAKLPEAAKI